MIPFHSLCPEAAQREVRCVHIGPGPGGGLLADEYAYVEYYCSDLDCDCRRVLLEVVARGQPGKVLASIGYGWEKESFYRKRMDGDLDEARRTVRGELDPLNPQSQFAEELLELFKRFVLDEPYRLRLRRHYKMFKEELARRGPQAAGS